MVDLSDHGNLPERFLALPLPKIFMYGQQNGSLSYLRRLADDVPHFLDHGVWPLTSPSGLGAVNSIRSTVWPLASRTISARAR
jgi:hypothetical protein